jgi:adenosylcobinamide kinase / adenosylcobinamide-phosphate guanylyltransferase
MLTLLLGGARSGKSGYAQSLIGERTAIYVATARRHGDREMRSRIDRHRADRPGSWITIEEPESVPFAVRAAVPRDAPVIVECATLWLSNLFERESHTPARKQQDILLNAVRELAEVSRSREVIVVSNEVGCGIVPATRVGRRFRDLQGWANQILAEEAATVILIIAGVPLVLKRPDTPRDNSMPHRSTRPT